MRIGLAVAVAWMALSGCVSTRRAQDVAMQRCVGGCECEEGCARQKQGCTFEAGVCALAVQRCELGCSGAFEG
jgi:hypothetical protein